MPYSPRGTWSPTPVLTNYLDDPAIGADVREHRRLAQAATEATSTVRTLVAGQYAAEVEDRQARADALVAGSPAPKTSKVEALTTAIAEATATADAWRTAADQAAERAQGAYLDHAGTFLAALDSRAADVAARVNDAAESVSAGLAEAEVIDSERETLSRAMGLDWDELGAVARGIPASSRRFITASNWEDVLDVAVILGAVVDLVTPGPEVEDEPPVEIVDTTEAPAPVKAPARRRRAVVVTA